MQGACTSARVYLDMHGPYDEMTSGEIRLVNADVHQTCFKRNATDLFVVRLFVCVRARVCVCMYVYVCRHTGALNLLVYTSTRVYHLIH